MTKRTSIPTYETKHILGTVVLDPETKKKRIKIDHPKYYEHEINQLPVGSQVSMVITTKKPKRSVQQNRYMHLYFGLIALSSGHNEKYIKNWAKGKHLSKGVTEVFGDKVRMVDDTSDLTIGEMIEFLARVECDTGIPLPDAAPFNLGLSHEEWKELRDKERQKYMAMTPKLSPHRD